MGSKGERDLNSDKTLKLVNLPKIPCTEVDQVTVRTRNTHHEFDESY